MRSLVSKYTSGPGCKPLDALSPAISEMELSEDQTVTGYSPPADRLLSYRL